MPDVSFWHQASPERSTRTQQKEFQSNILDGVMEHLLAADVLLGQNQVLKRGKPRMQLPDFQ